MSPTIVLFFYLIFVLLYFAGRRSLPPRDDLNTTKAFPLSQTMATTKTYCGIV
jgi:hypothetical protein